MRFFRHLVVMQDEFYIKHMVDKQVLGPILDVLLRTLPRDNLLSSACLELFMLVSKENIKELIKQMMENYREKVMALAYIDTFHDILTRYDGTQGFTTNIDPFFESEDELGRGRPPPAAVAGGARGMMEHLVVDQAQEDYWNTSDDEDDLAAGQEPTEEELRRTLGMMDRSPSKPLVEYNSDEDASDPENIPPAGDDTVMTPADATTSTAAPTSTTPSPTTPSPTTTTTTTTTTITDTQPHAPSTPTNGTTTAAAAAAAATPPERLSEKRRREEDDDDDALDKLTQHKRRNNSNAVANANNAAGGGAPSGGGPATPQISVLRKKRSVSSSGGGSPKGGNGAAGGGGGGGNGGGGLRKIAISISPAVKAAGVKAGLDDGE